jgi:type II secretory pathway component PulF
MGRISKRELIGFCRRVGTSLRSGVGAVRVFEGESHRGSAAYRQAMTTVLGHVKDGDSITQGLHDSGYFPPVTLAMVEIGEHTGKLDEALARLAEQYDHQARMQRQLYLGIAWPSLQLLAGITIIGAMIYIFGVIGGATGSDPIDVTGLGLSGGRGALIYFLFLGFVFTAFATLVAAISKGWLGPWPVKVAMKLPLLGNALRHMALSRLTWSLGMALDAGIDAKRSSELAIMATQNPYYLSHTPEVVDTISRGQSFYEAFRDAEAFPQDFLDEMENAEIAGTLSESLVRMANEYSEKARHALQLFMGALTISIWVLFAAIMILLIFRMFMIYLSPIYEGLDALNAR